MRISILILTMLGVLFNTVSEAARPVSEQRDLKEILQTVIDAEQLSSYYHADVLPDRIPLRLIKNAWVDEDLQLIQFGRPVVILPGTDTSAPYLNISRVRINGDSATVSFEYPPEGLVGTATLSRQQDVWVLDAMVVHER